MDVYSATGIYIITAYDASAGPQVGVCLDAAMLQQCQRHETRA